ncbi:MAG: protein kinase, partial [Cyanobacteria bacterium]|nr:protein kinase [Cyanobacteriota bacterium]
MTNLEKTCPTCMKPLGSSTGGFVTQMIGVCHCAQQPAEVEANDDVGPIQRCGHCSKPIQRSRAGSLTQWIFSEGRCTCANPLPIVDTSIPNAVTLRAEDDWVAVDDNDELTLMPGTFPMDRYSPKVQLGAGASGIVYMARDRLLNKKVAVKTLRQLTGEQLILFQEEARVTSKLNHPNVIKILDFGPTESGTPYMVLEYIENVTSL